MPSSSPNDLGPGGFEGSNDLAADVRQLVNRVAGAYARIPAADLAPDRTTRLGTGLDDRARSDDRPAAALAHHEFLREAARWFTTTHEIDGRLLVDMIEGTFLYRGLLGARDTRELADQITRLMGRPSAPDTAIRESSTGSAMEKGLNNP